MYGKQLSALVFQENTSQPGLVAVTNTLTHTVVVLQMFVCLQDRKMREWTLTSNLATRVDFMLELRGYNSSHSQL
jgi:hypothetical protein